MQGEAIYKGATRPAMKLGIPLVPLVVLTVVTGLDYVSRALAMRRRPD